MKDQKKLTTDRKTKMLTGSGLEGENKGQISGKVRSFWGKVWVFVREKLERAQFVPSSFSSQIAKEFYLSVRISIKRKSIVILSRLFLLLALQFNRLTLAFLWDCKQQKCIVDVVIPPSRWNNIQEWCHVPIGGIGTRFQEWKLLRKISYIVTVQ